jgi:hypothetical protein
MILTMGITFRIAGLSDFVQLPVFLKKLKNKSVQTLDVCPSSGEERPNYSVNLGPVIAFSYL